VDVCPGAEPGVLTAGLFGRDVAGIATRRSPAGQTVRFVQAFGHTEVNELRASGLGEQDVARPEIQMHDAMLMKMMQCSAKLFPQP
jgi:hypothetical protein